MIKFWPNKKAHTIDVEIVTGGVTLRFSLDLEEAADASIDFSDAIAIATEDWIES